MRDEPHRLGAPVCVGMHHLKAVEQFALGHTDDGQVCLFVNGDKPGLAMDVSAARLLATCLVEIAEGIESGSARGALSRQ